MIRDNTAEEPPEVDVEEEDFRKLNKLHYVSWW